MKPKPLRLEKVVVVVEKITENGPRIQHYKCLNEGNLSIDPCYWWQSHIDKRLTFPLYLE